MSETDPWMAYQIDRAVTSFGIVIDNALQERVSMGDDSKTTERYTLEQLLSKDFKLPRPEVDTEALEMVDGMMYDSV